MSLHAVLSPEVLARLERQKRNSTISSIIVAILTIILVGVALALFLLPAVEEEFEGVQYIRGASDTDRPIKNPSLRPDFQKKPSSPKAVANSIVTNIVSDVAIPRSDSQVSIEGLLSGSGNGIGNEGDDWEDDRGGFLNVHIPYEERCSKSDRLARIDKHGGIPKVEDAVVKALLWMKENQSSDGSWGTKHKVGMTGLALLTYLGHCETPESEEFGESCISAIVYLLQIGTQNDGRLATNLNDRHWPYEHAIATYALAEAFSFGGKNGYGIPQHKEVLTQATQWILDHQHTSGGWDYAYET